MEPLRRALVPMVNPRSSVTFRPVPLCHRRAIGCALLRESHFDLVITEIVMPDMDGLEVIKAVKRKIPSQMILAISGRSNSYLDLAERLGATRIMVKPIDTTRFVHEVDDCLTHG